MGEALFLLSPMLIAFVLIAVLPKVRRLTALNGSVAPTFYLAVALHFALFANLLTGEIWTNVVRANQAISREVSGLQSMLRIAEASLGACSIEIQDSVSYYRKEVVEEEFQATATPILRDKIFPLAKLYRLLVIDPEFIPNPTMKSLFRDSLEQVRASRYERLELKEARLSPVKLWALYAFGVLTLLAVAVYHCTHGGALVFTSLLFGCCFSMTLTVISVLDHPYRFPFLVSASPFDRAF